MATTFKQDIDYDAQQNVRDRVNGVLKPFSSTVYPNYCRRDLLTTFDSDPLMAHPSFYGVISNDTLPQSLHVRTDAIALGNQYGNLIRCRYGNHTLNGIVGEGYGYFACREDLGPMYDPATDPEVDKLAVGGQNGFYGYSNGGPQDDGVAGTDTNVGSINGLNTTNDRVRLSNWGCDYCGTNANGLLYLRLNRSARTANGWAVTLYDQNKKVIGNSLLKSRMDVSSGYAYVLQEPFNLAPYLNQIVYIRIRANPPPITIPQNTVSAQRARIANMLNGIGSIGGTMFRDGPRSLYRSVYQVIAANINDYTVDLTTYAETSPVLPAGANRFTVGTGNGFTGFSDGGGVDDGVAGTNTTCGAIDDLNRTDQTKIGNWVSNYFGTNSSGYLYMRLRGVGETAPNWELALYDEQYNVIIKGLLEYRGSGDAIRFPTPFDLTPYIGRTIYISIQ